jgi:hypothetical protein
MFTRSVARVEEEEDAADFLEADRFGAGAAEEGGDLVLGAVHAARAGDEVERRDGHCDQQHDQRDDDEQLGEGETILDFGILDFGFVGAGARSAEGDSERSIRNPTSKSKILHGSVLERVKVIVAGGHIAVRTGARPEGLGASGVDDGRRAGGGH